MWGGGEAGWVCAGAGWCVKRRGGSAPASQPARQIAQPGCIGRWGGHSLPSRHSACRAAAQQQLTFAAVHQQLREKQPGLRTWVGGGGGATCKDERR